MPLQPITPQGEIQREYEKEVQQVNTCTGTAGLVNLFLKLSRPTIDLT